MSIAVNDFLTSALQEIRVARAGDVVSPNIMTMALSQANEMVDSLNANKLAVYDEPFADYTFTPSLNPHTIGSGGTFNATQRPQEILGALVNLGGTPNAFSPITIRNRQWYEQQVTPGLTQSFPTDLYYDAAWPLGKIYFVGVPTVAYGVRLWLRVLLTSIALGGTLTLPPGYQEALRLTLAEKMAPSFGQSVSPETEEHAKNARALIWGSNVRILNQQTRDGGMPGAQPSGFNFYNGQVI